MKLAAQIVLFIFIVFLSTPTIVSLIKKDKSISVVYSISDEEKLTKEMNFEIKSFVVNFSLNLPNPSSGIILSENLSKHDKIAFSIFIPPPDFV